MDTPQTVMTTTAPAVLKILWISKDTRAILNYFCSWIICSSKGLEKGLGQWWLGPKVMNVDLDICLQLGKNHGLH